MALQRFREIERVGTRQLRGEDVLHRMAELLYGTGVELFPTFLRFRELVQVGRHAEGQLLLLGSQLVRARGEGGPGGQFAGFRVGGE